MTNRLIPESWSTQGGNNFDSIRLAMALLVVWSHSFALYLGTEAREPVSRLLSGTYNSGNIGVMVFFIISGFLVTHSFCRSSTVASYMKRRVLRIYPGYMVATTLCAFVVVPWFSTIRDLSLIEAVKTIAGNLLLRNYFPPSNVFTANPLPNAVNGSLWSIPFEFWCYIGVAILGIAGLLTRRWLILAATVGVLVGRVVLDILDKKPGGGIVELVFGWPYMWFVIAPSFMLGMIAYFFRDTIPRSRGLLALLAVLVVFSAYRSSHLMHLVFAPALAYATFYFAFSNSLPFHGAAKNGDFSYGTYLYAFPIQQMLFAAYGHKLDFASYIVVSMVLSLIAGVCSWHLVEKWFVARHAKPRAPALKTPAFNN